MKNKFAIGILFLTLFVFAMLISCSKSIETYYPLKEGMTWEYQNTFGSHPIKGAEKTIITNLASQKLKGKKVTPQKVEIGGQSHLSFLTEDADGLYEFTEQQPVSVGQEKKSSPFYIIKYPIKAGTTWERMTKTSLSNVPVTLKYTIEGIDENVTVPAGTFKGCVKVNGVGDTKTNFNIFGGTIIITITVEHFSWYAPKVGLVKSIIKEKSSHIYEAGEWDMTMQLESFKKSK
ncbi:MAG: hypothetical protein HY739_13365 [Desulfobacterales bacterium]|nr:hypothetical protein [Desulfobacterales bacterium]